MILPFLDRSPSLDESVFVAPGAAVIGDVTLGAESSVWFNTTLRADVHSITVGRRTNIQDNCCIHVTRKTCPTVIGDEVTVGHCAMIHGCTIGDCVLVGIQATILDRAVVEPHVILAAGSLVPPGAVLESGFLYMGAPARKKRELSAGEIDSIREHASNYLLYARAHQGLDSYDRNPFYDS